MVSELSEKTGPDQAAEALRECQDLFAKAFRLSPDGMAIVRMADRTLITANEAICRIWGSTTEEVAGQPVAKYTNWLSEEQRLGFQQTRMETGECMNYEMILQMQDGRMVLFKNSSRLISLDGEPCLLSVMRDITEERRLALALNSSELRYRRLFETAKDGILILDAVTGMVMDVNPFLVELLGFSHEQFLGKAIWELGFFRDVLANEEKFAELRDKEYVRYEDLPLETRDGRTIAVEFVSNVYLVEGEKVIQCNVRDVTGRKQAEAALKTSELRYHTLFDNMVEGYAFCRIIYTEGKADDLVYLEVNKAFEALTGMENVIGRKVSELAPGIHHSNPELLELYSRVAVSGRTEKAEIYVPVLARWFSITVYSSKPGHFIAVFDNITKRKQAEEELLWKTAFLEAQVNSSQDATIVVDRLGRKILQNQRTADLFQIPQNIVDDPDDGKQVRWVTDTMKDPVAFAERVTFLYAHPEQAGHDEIELKSGIILDRYSFPVTGRDGSYFGRTWTFRDITERKHSEENQRLETERLRLAAEAGQVGIWEFDVLTQQLEWDPQMHVLYGLERDGNSDLIELSQRAIHPEDRERLITAFHEALRSRDEPLNTEFRIVRLTDGCQRILRSMATVIWNDSGEPLRMIGTNWDVTEERTRERKLAEALAQEKELSEKARAGDRAKGDFLAVMSHEIRTPLNGILGFSQLLARSPDLPAESRDYVETITSSGEALLRILNDVLDYSRLEAGHIQVEKTSFPPREILGDIHSLLSQQARDKKLAFDLSIEEDIPAILAGDAGRLRQILLNLTGNAIKFTDSGCVTLGLRSMPGAAHYEFFVKDTGCGISAAQIERLFQPFTQADSSTSRRHGGTGLGLSISRRLAEVLGGTLTVRSEMGKGSEFLLDVTLGEGRPLPEPETPPQSLDSSFAAKHPLRILVVEDDKVSLKLMLALIRKLGYEPLSAANGREAVEIQRHAQPDCVLMDIQMPEMDGIEATEKIRAGEAHRAVKPAFISALTANIVAADRERCFDAGMNTYLNKPLKMAALASVLNEASEHAAKEPRAQLP